MPFFRKRLDSPSPRRRRDFWRRVATVARSPRVRFWLKRAFFVFAVFAILGVFVFTVFAAWVSRDLPDPNTLSTREVPQSTKIYDRTGTTLLYEIHGDENRTLVKFEDIPEDVKHATVAIEDKAFYEHHGVYWKGVFRALLVKITGRGKLQGASTLTQQLVKNAILTNERTVIRKVKEFVLALQIERIYSKDQILQLYLNEIPYGSTIYGVESAAQSYFGKPAKELTLDEAALVAAIPQAPDYYSPYGTGSRGDNRPRLIVRQHYILDLMAEQGYVTKAEAEAAKQVDTLKKLKPKRLGDIKAPHFVMYVRGLLSERYGQKTVEQGGLKVTTTLDWKKQQIAEEEVKKGVEAKGKQYGFNNAALVSLDPKNGQILAMVGSKDYFDTDIDGNVNVTLAKRQPGSSFKPFAYAVGFMQGYLPETQLWDVNTVFKTDTKSYEPRDYDVKERGPVTIRKALQGSLNIPAVKMLYLAGVSRVLDFAEELGYTTFDDRSRFGLSLVLGGGEVKPLEHAAAYAAFANDGVAEPASAILKVTDAKDATLEEWSAPEGKQAMDPQIARLVSNVLSDNDSRAYVFGTRNALTLPDRPVAAKTGTTNNFHDAWTAGYVPNHAAVVWVGNTKNEEMKKGADGSVVAAPIWQAYMRRAMQDLPIERFKAPAPSTVTKPALLGRVVEQKVRVDRVSGKRATEYTPPDQVEERTFYETHDILYYVDKDDPTGPAPSNPASDPQFVNWETAVQDWVQRTQWHTTNTIPLLYDDVHTPGSQPQVTVLAPANDQAIPTRELAVAVDANASRPIVRVEVLINNQLIGAFTSAPWQSVVRIPNSVEKGFHELTLVAIDDVGNRGQASVTINLTAEREGPAGVSLVAPANDTIWSRASFPKSVDVLLDDPSLYRRVDILFIGSDGIERLAASEILPSNPALHFNLTLGPPAGRYRLVVAGRYKLNETSVTAEVGISVTE